MEARRAHTDSIRQYTEWGKGGQSHAPVDRVRGGWSGFFLNESGAYQLALCGNVFVAPRAGPAGGAARGLRAGGGTHDIVGGLTIS